MQGLNLKSLKHFRIFHYHYHLVLKIKLLVGLHPARGDMFFKLIKAPLLSVGVYCCVMSKNCKKKPFETSWLFFPDDHASRDNTDQLTISRGLRAGLQQGRFQHMAWEPSWKRLPRLSNNQRAKLGDCFRNFGLGKGFFSFSKIKPTFWKFIDLRMLTI